MDDSRPSTRRKNLKLLAGVLILVGATLALTPFSSEKPDGLEFAAETLHFAEAAQESPLPHLENGLGPWAGRIAGLLLAAGISTLFLLNFRRPPISSQ